MTDSEKLKIAVDGIAEAHGILFEMLDKIDKEIEKEEDAKVNQPGTAEPQSQVSEDGREGDTVDWESIESCSKNTAKGDDCVKNARALLELKAWQNILKTSGEGFWQVAEDQGRQITKLNKRVNKANNDALETFALVADRLDDLEKRVPTLEQMTTGALKAIKKTLIEKQRYDAAAKIREVIVMLTGENKPELPEMLNDDKVNDADVHNATHTLLSDMIRNKPEGEECICKDYTDTPNEIAPDCPICGEPDSPQPGDLVWWRGCKGGEQIAVRYYDGLLNGEIVGLVRQDECRELRIAKDALENVLRTTKMPRKYLGEFMVKTLKKIGNKVTIERRTE